MPLDKVVDAPATVAVATAPQRTVRERLRLPLMAAFPILLGAVGANYCITVGGHVSTDDAFVRAAKESVNARVTRKWWKLPVKNNERVKKGQLLFRLDPEPFQIAIERADAALDGARLQIDALKAT